MQGAQHKRPSNVTRLYCIPYKDQAIYNKAQLIHIGKNRALLYCNVTTHYLIRAGDKYFSLRVQYASNLIKFVY